MGKAIGIDLGTTNTAVAVLVDGRPRVLEDEKGYKVLPSCVSLKPSKNGEAGFVVGQAAKNLIVTRPDRTVYAVKRLMGRRFDSPEVQAIKRLVGYPIAEAEDGTCKVKMGDMWYTPVEISALILDVAKTTAERTLGEPVDEAVITVPAYFNHAQRTATFEAAQRAGLRCERLLNEPTAAALAYGHRRDVDRTIVVYDLGGGTFDVSVLRLSHGVYEVLSTSGETHLGGEDFDQRVVEHLADQFASDTGVDLRRDGGALQRLKDAGERAKCELSFTDRTSILIPRVTMADNLETTLTRLALEGMVEDLIQKTLEITKAAVRDANLRINQVDEVILVGGQTRMPRVREAIGSLFQKEPSRTVHPEEVVAIGAAVHANALTAAPAAGTAHAVLLDVTPFDLGIDIVGGKFEPIIKRNSQVPTQATKTFYTNKDGQDSVKVTVRQGERGAAADNEFLGEFVMTGLTPAARMQTKVEVTFRLDMNGMLHVAAVEPGSGEKKRITIRNYAEFAKGGVGVEVEGDVQPVAAAPASEAPRQGGLLSRLFGGGKKKDAPAAPPAARAPTVAPEPAVTLSAAPSPAVSAPAGVDLEPLGLGMSPGLDLGPLTMEDVGEAWPEPPAALDLPLDAADIIEDLPLSEADVLEELGASPGAAEAAAPTAPRSAAPVAADPFAGDPFGDDPFEADPFDADPFGAAPSVEPAGGPTGTSAGEGAPEAFAFEEEDEAPPVAPTAAAAGGGLSWGDDDPFGDLPAAPLHDPFTARPKDDEPESFALPDDEEEHEIDALDALDAFDAADPTPTLGLTETPTGPGTAGVDDFLSSLTDVDDDLKAMLDALEEPAPSPARGALPGFAPFTAPTGASPQARTDIFDRGALSLSDFEDEDSDIELITSASVDQRPAVTADADAPIATGGADDGDVDYDDIPDDDLVQFSRQGGAHSEVTEASFGLSLDEEEDADDEATDPGPSRAGAARLRVEYRRHDAMLREYRENLSKNGCFIKTGAPLRLGRICLIEVRAPGLRKPLVIPGVVSWTSQGMARLPPDQAAGMGITWQLDQAQRGELERILRT